MAAVRAVDIFKRIGSRLSEGDLFRKAFIGGAWKDTHSKQTFPVYNPATGEAIAQVSDMDKDDVLEAISQAHMAQKTWRSSTAKVSNDAIYSIALKFYTECHKYITTFFGIHLGEGKYSKGLSCSSAKCEG